MDFRDLSVIEGKFKLGVYDFKNNRVYRTDKLANFTALLKKLEELGLDVSAKEDFIIEARLKMLHCEITERCNLRCRHCYGDFGKGQNELPKEGWFDIFDQAKAMDLKVLQLIGGEPLLRTDVEELIRYADGLEFKHLDIFSNLTVLDGKVFKALQDAKNVEVRFSVYGHKPTLHDDFTRVRRSFEKSMNNAKLLKEAGIDVRAECLLTRQNCVYKSDIKDFFGKEGIEIGFGIIRPCGRAEEDLELVPGEIGKVCRLPDECGIERAPAGVSKEKFYLRRQMNECFSERMAISANGTVYPCIFEREITLGDVKSESLDVLYERAIENAKKYRIDEVETCKECELKYGCFDCRPWAKSLTQREFARNPYCHHKVEDTDI